MIRMTTAVGLLFCSQALAVPVQWEMSTRVLDVDGDAIEGQHAVRVSLYDSESGTPSVWSDDFANVVVSSGYFTVELGSDTVGNPLDQSILAESELWLGVTLNPGGGGVEMAPRKQILATPYARRAEVAEVAIGLMVGDPGVVACETNGQMLFDGGATLHVCNGTQWLAVGGVGLSDHNGVVYFADDAVAESCEAYIRPTMSGYRYAGAVGDGLYRIDPDGSGGTPPVDVWCDMSTDGGGWTLTAAVVTQGAFWRPDQYSPATGARSVSIGTASPDSNYVLHLETWKDLLAARGSDSELRLRVRRIDNNQDATLGRLVGLQMASNGTFSTNPSAVYKGDGTLASSATGACVIAYSSNFTGVTQFANFDNTDSPCTSFMGWNGSCGHTSMGHEGSYAGSGTDRFAHSCSLDLEYYCSANRTTGPTDSGTVCHYYRKVYYIR